MRQRGRKSAEGLAALNLHGEGARLPVPSSLDADERSAFAALIRCCDPAHFRESDSPLLISYIQATLLARSAAHDVDKIAIWERAVKIQAMLATRLRLAPQARTDPRSLARQLRPFPGLPPWHRDEVGEDDHEGGES